MASTTAGKAVNTINVVATIVHVNGGRRSIVIPGARRPAIVARMHAASTMSPTLATSTPAHHRSMPEPGVQTVSDRGSVAIHVALPAPLRLR
jgi:hypothetical protein